VAYLPQSLIVEASLDNLAFKLNEYRVLQREASEVPE